MIEETQVSLPNAWQRAETVNGVPYYINHDTETTHWDHPEMTQLMTDMSVADDIKYAAYRTAVKLRAIEKITQLYLIDLSAIRAGFNDLGYSESFTEDEVDVQSLKGILKEIFSYQSTKSNDVDVADGVELTLNWLLNVYDKARSGSLRILSAKIGLACLSVASVQEKYKYIFDQLSSSKGFIDKKRLRVFLKDAMQMLKYIREYNSFGRAGVEPAVQSCFERAFIPERICLQEFLDWMIDEPQTVVWLPTLHRLAMSETVKHEGKCNICKMFPIVGFRYRCLKCFNFDLCQNCFWSGRVSKNHKLTHQTQEYCLPATQKEDIKDFAKVVKSKVRKKKKKTKRKVPSKSRFLPISNDGTAQASDEEKGADHVDYGDNESTTSFESRISLPLRETDKTTSKEMQPSSSRVLRSRPVLDDEHQLISYYTSCLNDSPQPTTSTPILTLARLDREQVKELDEIVENLEDDNRYLREKILEIQDVEARRSIGQTEEKDRIEEYNERLEARQEVLEDHNQRLEDQLAKLRSLIQQEKYVPGGNNVEMQTPTIFSRSEDILNHPYKSIDAACQYRKDPVKRTQSSSTSPYNYERLRPLPVSKDTPQYSPVQSKQNMTSHSKHSTSTGYPWENVSERPFKMPDANDDIAATIISTTSDDDLRAIEIRLERLLEPDIAEEDEKAREGVESKAGMLDDSDPNFSDDQQNYLLSAASMVGEAVEDFVSSLSRENSGWNYLKLDFTDDEEEV